MQEDALRDFLKFFRFHLPWFVISAGFFAVIILAGLFISSKINLSNKVADNISSEKLELSVNESERVQKDSKRVEIPSTPSVITVPSPPSIVTPQPVSSATPVPEPVQIPIKEATKVTDDSTYVVAAGDSLWTIAERVYGTGFEYKQIMKANNIDNHFELRTGQTLVIPANPDKGQITSGVSIDHGDEPVEVSQQNDYKVIKGDSLWKIAEQQLDNPYRWIEIYELNKTEIGKNPNLIFSGNTLKLPEKLVVKSEEDDSTSSSSSTNTSSNWTSSLLQ